MKTMLGLGMAILVAAASGCVVNRTVRDASGNVIYSEPEVRMPFESEEKRRADILEKERKLGW